MVVVGADVHKRTHTFVAVDEVGRKLAEKVVAATTAGHHQAVVWARDQFGTGLRWGIEDCRHLSARLERDLLTCGQQVVRVPPKLMAQSRASARTRGKSDPIDALAVARAVLREPDLPVASHDEVSRELKLLVDRREDLVGQRTSTINRLLWRVHELDPAHAPKAGSLDRAKHRELLGQWLATQAGLVAELARDELSDITRLTESINALAKRIGAPSPCDRSDTAGDAGLRRVDCSQDHRRNSRCRPLQERGSFARHSGVAPIPVWSGNTAGRVRMTRSGNRQLNAALHRIAVTQIRLDGLARLTTASDWPTETPAPKPCAASNAAWPA